MPVLTAGEQALSPRRPTRGLFSAAVGTGQPGAAGGIPVGLVAAEPSVSLQAVDGGVGVAVHHVEYGFGLCAAIRRDGYGEVGAFGLCVETSLPGLYVVVELRAREVLLVVVVAEGHRVGYAPAYRGLEGLVQPLGGGAARCYVAGVYHDVGLLLVQYAVHVGGGFGCLGLACNPVDVGELYYLQSAFPVEAHALCAGAEHRAEAERCRAYKLAC